MTHSTTGLCLCFLTGSADGGPSGPSAGSSTKVELASSDIGATLQRGDQLLHALIPAAERVFAQHGALSLVDVGAFTTPAGMPQAERLAQGAITAQQQRRLRHSMYGSPPMEVVETMSDWQ